MGHGLFAVDIFSGADGVDDDLLVPMIGDSGDEAIDFLVVEEIFVAASGENSFAHDFAGEGVAAVVEVAGGDAFDAGELEGVVKQAGALHADADDAEAQAVAGSDGLHGEGDVFGHKKNGGGGRERAGGPGGAMEELAAGEIFFHGALLGEVNSRRLKVESANQKPSKKSPSLACLTAIAPLACSRRKSGG